MSLKNRISALAEEFSVGVLAAIRSASLEEILSESGVSQKRVSAPVSRSQAPRSPASHSKVSHSKVSQSQASQSQPSHSQNGHTNGASPNGDSEPVRRGPGRPLGSKNTIKAGPRNRGRLARRSPEQIALVVESVVVALKKNKNGMRSEQLQKLLKLDKKEISGPLTEALAGKKITKKGQRRATTYFAR